MPSFCSVVDCSNRGMRDNVRFFKIPRALNFKHKTYLNVLSSIRRKKWIFALKRNDLTETKLKYAQVCSNHFIMGKPAGLTDYMNPDWIPSVNMGYKAKIKTLGCSSRFQNLNKGIALKTEITEMSGVTQTCSYFTCGMSVKTEPNRSRYRFPVRDPDRCKKWILNSGRPDLLELPSDQLNARFICAKHFQKNFFFGKMLKITAVPDVCQLDHPAEETRTYSNILKERKSATKASNTSLESIPGRSVIQLGSSCESTNSRIRYSEDSKIHSISQQKRNKSLVKSSVGKRRKNVISKNQLAKVREHRDLRIKLKTSDVLVPSEQEVKAIPTALDNMDDSKPYDTSVLNSSTSSEAPILFVIPSKETHSLKTHKEDNLIEHEIPDVQDGIEENVIFQKFSLGKADNLTQTEERNIQEEDYAISEKSDGEKDPRQRIIVLETDRIELIIHEDFHEGEYTGLKACDNPTWNPTCFLETEDGINCGTRSVAVQTNLGSEFERKSNKKCQNCSLHCRLPERSSVINLFEELIADLS